MIILLEIECLFKVSRGGKINNKGENYRFKDIKYVVYLVI